MIVAVITSGNIEEVILQLCVYHSSVFMTGLMAVRFNFYVTSLKARHVFNLF